MGKSVRKVRKVVGPDANLKTSLNSVLIMYALYDTEGSFVADGEESITLAESNDQTNTYVTYNGAQVTHNSEIVTHRT